VFFGYVPLNLDHAVQSPYGVIPLLVFKRKEDYDNMQQNLSPLICEIQDLQASGLNIGGCHYTITFFLAGDMKSLWTSLGVGGWKENDCCTHCEVRKSQQFDTHWNQVKDEDFSYLQKHKARSISQLKDALLKVVSIDNVVFCALHAKM
jgi:hypothetical protein